jgi:hypothetical protein
VAVRSSLNARLPLTAALLATLLAPGCAAPPPPLPADTTSVDSASRVTLKDFTAADAALSCTQIADERRRIAADMATANHNIEANRHDNQVAGFIGATVVPLGYLGTEGNYADKEAIQRLYARQDVLIKLAGVKSCPAP